MIEIEKTEVYGWEAAIRGMRNPLNSWAKGDSENGCTAFSSTQLCSECPDYTCEPGLREYIVGREDQDLAMRLCRAGTEHRKFMRMIGVSCDVTAPQFWWMQMDTYKVGTTKNSCSKMHKLHVKGFERNDFSHEGIDEVGGDTLIAFNALIDELEYLRTQFNETQERRYWRAMLELLPSGYNMRATWLANYEVLANVYRQRKGHKLGEWAEFLKWVEELPYSGLITGDCR